MSEKSFFDILFYTDRDAQCREVFYGDPDTEKIYYEAQKITNRLKS